MTPSTAARCCRAFNCHSKTCSVNSTAKDRPPFPEPAMTRVFAILALFACLSIAVADPCKSGPQPNQRPGPYSALVSVGKERGMQHCYICESANRPVVIVFARTMSDPLGKLVKKLDDTVKDNKTAEMRSWVTFLADDQTKMDPLVVKWAKQHAIGLPSADT